MWYYHINIGMTVLVHKLKWTIWLPHPTLVTIQWENVAEAIHLTAKGQMDSPTYEIKHITRWRPWQEELRIIVNRWEHWMQSCLSLSFCLSTLSLSGKGSAVLLSRGRKYGSCQGPYDAASAVYTQRQEGRLMARTWRHKKFSQRTLNLTWRVEGRYKNTKPGDLFLTSSFFFIPVVFVR